jgi:hypothetical protein
VIKLIDSNPATGVDLMTAIIPAAIAFVVLVVLFIMGKTGKKKK